MPELNKLYGSYKGQGLVLIGIHCDPDIAKRNATVKELKVTYPICQAIGESTMTAYKIEYFPTVYVIGKNGKIIAADPENLEKVVKAALKQK